MGQLYNQQDHIHLHKPEGCYYVAFQHFRNLLCLNHEGVIRVPDDQKISTITCICKCMLHMNKLIIIIIMIITRLVIKSTIIHVHVLVLTQVVGR